MKNAKIIALVLLVVFTLTLVSSCGKSSGEKVTLNVLNWGEYLDPELLDEFEDANPGIKINYITATSNEEFYTMVSTEGSEVDVLFPSDYLVERLLAEDLVAEIDHSKLSNYKYVADVSDQMTFDPGAHYSIPYFQGTLGIVYNKTLVDETVDSWDILWNEKYAKNILMYDSLRDSLAVALIRLGYSINTEDPDELNEAADLLIEQKPLVLAYETDSIMTSMIGGSVALAIDFSGAACAALMENEDLGYCVPKEGSNVWTDCVVVMKSSKKYDAAMKFIDFLCDPEVAAQNSEYVGYTTVNSGALELISEDYLNNEAYYMPENITDSCVYYVDPSPEALKIWNDAWMKVKTAK